MFVAGFSQKVFILEENIITHKAFNNLSIFALQSKDPVKIVTVRTTAFEADESQGDAVSETTLDAPGIELR